MAQVKYINTLKCFAEPQQTTSTVSDGLLSDFITAFHGQFLDTVELR